MPARHSYMVCFGCVPVQGYVHKFVFCGKVLPVVASALHLGHVLSANLDDSDGILRVTRDMARKANCMLITFAGLDLFVKINLSASTTRQRSDSSCQWPSLGIVWLT